MKIRDIPRLAKTGAALGLLAYVLYHLNKDLFTLTAEHITLTTEPNANERQKIILYWLKKNPGMVQIGPSGKTLFALTESLSGTPMLLEITGPDFNKMAPIEIDEYVQKKLEQHLEENVEFREGYREITAEEFLALPFKELSKRLVDNYDIVKNEETGTVRYVFKGKTG